LYIRTFLICSLLSAGAFAAEGERTLLGEAGNIIPQSIVVAPDGARFIAVIVDPKTKKRRVVVNGQRLPGVYDEIAKETPIFSPDGKRYAFVASRLGKCFVVADGKEGRNYEIVDGRWPIADLVFSPTRSRLAYKALRGGNSYLVVDEKEFGPYEDVTPGEGGKVPGIGDFRFAGDDTCFSYRAKVADGMVACRGWSHDGKVELATSKAYAMVGAGTPVWLRGKAGEKGHLFAFVARENKKEFVALLPEPKKQEKKPKRYDLIWRGSLICAPNHTLGFLARGEDNKWRVVVGDKEWPPFDRAGQPLHSPTGQRWACVIQRGESVAMQVDGKTGAAYEGIRYPETVFAAGDERVVYAAVKEGLARVVTDGKEGVLYPRVDGASIVFAPGGARMACGAGDGKKQFVVLDGKRGPASERVSHLRFSPSGKRFSYRSQTGLKIHLVIDRKLMGPYAEIAPGSPVYSQDEQAAAWAAMGEDGLWRVYTDGKAGPPFDAVVSRLAFAPGEREPFYVARKLAGGKTSFALVSAAGMGREYTSIWMGDGGKLFLREDKRVDYFAKRGPLVYKVTDPVVKPPEKKPAEKK